MSEMILIGMLVPIGIVALFFYITFVSLKKKRRLRKINEQGLEMIRIEKELDKTDALKRGQHVLGLDKSGKINSN